MYNTKAWFDRRVNLKVVEFSVTSDLFCRFLTIEVIMNGRISFGEKLSPQKLRHCATGVMENVQLIHIMVDNISLLSLHCQPINFFIRSSCIINLRVSPQVPVGPLGLSLLMGHYFFYFSRHNKGLKYNDVVKFTYCNIAR